jgi:hypothetical protein
MEQGGVQPSRTTLVAEEGPVGPAKPARGELLHLIAEEMEESASRHQLVYLPASQPSWEAVGEEVLPAHHRYLGVTGVQTRVEMGELRTRDHLEFRILAVAAVAAVLAPLPTVVARVEVASSLFDF